MKQSYITTITGVGPIPIIFLAILAAALMVYTIFTLDPRLRKKTKVLIILLRLSMLVTGLLFFMQPALTTLEIKTKTKKIAVLVDASASMSIPAKESRIKKAQQLISEKLINATTEKNQSFEFYSLASTVKKIDNFKDIKLHENENTTDIISALNFLADIDDDSLIGAILLSDGAHSISSKSISQIRQNVPVNTVFIPGEQGPDLSISQIKADSFAFVRRETPIEVQVTSNKLNLTQTNVFLKKDGKLVQKQKINLLGGKGKAHFKLIPKNPGIHVYTIEIPILENDVNTANNTRHFEIKVTRDKLKVLHLSGNPSHDQRFLRSFLDSQLNILTVSFYMLRTPEQSASENSEGLSLIPFPTKDLFENHLDEFDILIFQNFNPGDVGVDAFLNQIANFIKNGGSLLMLGNQNGLSAPSIMESKLHNLLPLNLLPANTPANRLINEHPFTPQLTESGLNHPVMQFTSEYDNKRELFRNMPRLSGIINSDGLRENALALLVHPSYENSHGPVPLMAVKEPEKGRTMIISTDSLWTWSFTSQMSGAPSLTYKNLLSQAMKWLTADPSLNRLRIENLKKPDSLEHVSNFKISLFSKEYQPMPGEPIKITMSWLDSNNKPQTHIEEGKTNKEGLYTLEWATKHMGPHTLLVSSKSTGLSASHNFLVNKPDNESFNMDPNENFLLSVAEQTKGTHQSKDLSLKKIKTRNTGQGEITNRTDTPLWSSPFALLILFTLLFSDWILRKKIDL